MALLWFVLSQATAHHQIPTMRPASKAKSPTSLGMGLVGTHLELREISLVGIPMGSRASEQLNQEDLKHLKVYQNVSTLLSLSLWRTVFLLVLQILSADSRDLGESQHVLRLPPGVRRATPHVEWNSTKSQSKLGMSRLDLTDLTIKPRDEIQRHQPNVYIHQWGYHQKYLQHTGQWTCKWQNIAKDKHANDQIHGGRPQTQCFPWDLTANHSGLFGVTISLTTNKCGDWKILQTYQIPYDLH